MITRIHNKQDVERLRYEVVRFYDCPEFNKNLKSYVISQLDSILNDNTLLQQFIHSQHLITNTNTPLAPIIANTYNRSFA